MIRPQTLRLGSLDCYSIDLMEYDSSTSPSPTDAGPRGLVVLCHGYGAPGSDLLGVVEHWISLLGDAAKRFRFLCPIAPGDLSELGMPGGRAWWPLNMSSLMEVIQAQRYEELHQQTPPGIDSARESLSELINQGKRSWLSPRELPRRRFR